MQLTSSDCAASATALRVAVAAMVGVASLQTSVRTKSVYGVGVAIYETCSVGVSGTEESLLGSAVG